MRIAQVAPLIESVPPQAYGGTERVVSYLTEELVARGHDVTLFASGDSVTSATLVAGCPRALRLGEQRPDPVAHHLAMLEQLARRRGAFDVIHFHLDYLQFPLGKRLRWPAVTTQHGRLDLPSLVPLFREFPDEPVVSISFHQRAPLPWLNWKSTVYHGLPVDLYREGRGAGGYLAFLGRVSAEKGLERAVEISRRAGFPLKIAAKVDPNPFEEDYFRRVIEPLLAHSPHVEYLGEMNDRGKQELLGGARALLFPIDWPEPFGIVMIESLACGTPVVAFRRGSVPEVLRDGIGGFVVDTIDEAVRAVGRVTALDRARCRREFELRFTAGRMAEDYLRVYESVSGVSLGIPERRDLRFAGVRDG